MIFQIFEYKRSMCYLFFIGNMYKTFAGCSFFGLCRFGAALLVYDPPCALALPCFHFDTKEYFICLSDFSESQ